MKLVCEDQSGNQIAFYRGPLYLKSVDGIGSQYDISTSKNSGQDGVTYGGSTAKARNIVIVADVEMSDYSTQREALYQFFQPRTVGTLYLYDEDLPGKKISYYVEAVTPAMSGGVGHITVSLLCPDPRFYALEDQLAELATWVGLIEWPDDEMEFDEEDWELTTLVNTLIGIISNPSSSALGLTIKFMASGTVVKPSLYDVNRQELLKVNIIMHAGDTITVTTGSGNKHATLTSGGVTTNINNLLVYPPVWLQAYHGDNLFRYDAESGIDGLAVSILTTQAYWGA